MDTSFFLAIAFDLSSRFFVASLSSAYKMNLVCVESFSSHNNAIQS
jgi:hypothetical protein